MQCSSCNRDVQRIVPVSLVQAIFKPLSIYHMQQRSAWSVCVSHARHSKMIVSWTPASGELLTIVSLCPMLKRSAEYCASISDASDPHEILYLFHATAICMDCVSITWKTFNEDCILNSCNSELLMIVCMYLMQQRLFWYLGSMSDASNLHAACHVCYATAIFTNCSSISCTMSATNRVFILCDSKLHLIVCLYLLQQRSTQYWAGISDASDVHEIVYLFHVSAIWRKCVSMSCKPCAESCVLIACNRYLHKIVLVSLIQRICKKFVLCFSSNRNLHELCKYLMQDIQRELCLSVIRLSMYLIHQSLAKKVFQYLWCK